ASVRDAELADGEVGEAVGGADVDGPRAAAEAEARGAAGAVSALDDGLYTIPGDRELDQREGVGRDVEVEGGVGGRVDVEARQAVAVVDAAGVAVAPCGPAADTDLPDVARRREDDVAAERARDGGNVGEQRPRIN